MATIAQPNSLVDPPQARPLVVREGAVSFRDVTFRYGEGDSIIHDLSLTIRPGEKVGLVGPSGAGKSTLVNLCCASTGLKAAASSSTARISPG
jgi:ATP-binding cassette subfamily B multidrug efflux pump